MSSTKETKPASNPREHLHKRVSAFDVSPSVARMITDEEGDLDEKKAVAALSKTHDTNKHLWTGGFVLIGVVLFLIAANICTSVAVARLTRQLNVDPVTGMATIPGGDDVVMKTSTAVYSGEDINFHTASTKYLSTVETVGFKNGDLSFDVKGFARMNNETILLVEGGSLIFDINGLKNATGDKLTSLFSSINDDMKSIDPDGRKLGFARFNPLDAAFATFASATDSNWGSSNTGPTRDPRCSSCPDSSPLFRMQGGVPDLPGSCCLPADAGNGVRWGGSTCLCFGNEGDRPCWGDNGDHWRPRHGDQWLMYCDACTACTTFSLDVRNANGLPYTAEACCIGRSGSSSVSLGGDGVCPNCDIGETNYYRGAP